VHFYLRLVIGILVLSLLPINLIDFILVFFLAPLIVKPSQKLLVLLNSFLFVLFLSLPVLLVSNNLRSGLASHLY